MATMNMSGLEILSVGTWEGINTPAGGLAFTEEDLDEIVSAYEGNLESRIPVKLGHGDQALLDGLPAAGWVTNLRRQGNKLVADIRDIPARIGDLIAQGAWRNRSVELRKGAKLDGKTYKYMLTGLALLGSTLPAVNNLADIESLYTALSIDPPEKDATTLIFGEREPEKKERKVDERILQALKLEADASDDAILQAVTALSADASKTEADAEAAKVALSQENAALQQRVLALETSAAQRDAAAAVDSAIREGKILPAQRETSIQFALAAPAQFATFVEAQPVIVKFGETGSADAGQVDEFEPTEAEVAFGRTMGNTANDLKIQKYRDANRAVPNELLELQLKEHPALARS